MLSVNEIRKLQCKKSEQKKELYKTILLRFMKKIKVSVESGQNQVFLEIPAFITGWPLFDRAHATKYLARQLKNLGYDVTEYAEYTIYVCWTRSSQPAAEKTITEPLPPFVNIHKLANDIRIKNVSRH